MKKCVIGMGFLVFLSAMAILAQLKASGASPPFQDQYNVVWNTLSRNSSESPHDPSTADEIIESDITVYNKQLWEAGIGAVRLKLKQ